MEFAPAVLVGGGRRSSARAARAQAEAARELETARAVHLQNEKLNAALRRDGAKGRFTCTPHCPTCFPPETLAGADLPLDTLDLRTGAGTRPKVVLSGRRGKCRACGQKCGKRFWYCGPECRAGTRPKPAPRRCQCGCGQPLPDGSPDAKLYLDPTHQKRAARARQRARR